MPISYITLVLPWEKLQLVLSEHKQFLLQQEIFSVLLMKIYWWFRYKKEHLNRQTNLKLETYAKYIWDKYDIYANMLYNSYLTSISIHCSMLYQMVPTEIQRWIS